MPRDGQIKLMKRTHDANLESLLTIRDVAKRCRVDEKTVRRWIDRGELAAHKLGRQWRISERDLRKFLNDRWHG